MENGRKILIKNMLKFICSFFFLVHTVTIFASDGRPVEIHFFYGDAENATTDKLEALKAGEIKITGWGDASEGPLVVNFEADSKAKKILDAHKEKIAEWILNFLRNADNKYYDEINNGEGAEEIDIDSSAFDELEEVLSKLKLNIQQDISKKITHLKFQATLKSKKAKHKLCWNCKKKFGCRSKLWDLCFKSKKKKVEKGAGGGASLVSCGSSTFCCLQSVPNCAVCICGLLSFSVLVTAVPLIVHYCGAF